MDNISIGKGRDATQLRRLHPYWSHKRTIGPTLDASGMISRCPISVQLLAPRGGPHVFSRKLTGIEIGYIESDKLIDKVKLNKLKLTVINIGRQLMPARGSNKARGSEVFACPINLGGQNRPIRGGTCAAAGGMSRRGGATAVGGSYSRITELRF